ncbi:GNAT family N-acetyltransferase [Vallitalea maricola]|uniref:GNAT family N-acetyltransferase n=1 Tax=Vallitalea maricola TaxID=3074433 RepID=A0ACB5UMC3_9FIRM|nr:GNAT family N-acetyltransferase [Vallitalea sp. AN17-2]
MNNIEIRQLSKDEKIPYDLLLLADPSKELIDEYYNRGICYVAYDIDKIVGIYVLLKTRPLTMEIVNIAVDEDYQGNGIGKALLYHAIKKARENRAKILEIGTGNSSIAQLALYQKCGFHIDSINKGFFRKHYNEKIYENGIECIDMLRLSMEI